MTRNTWFVLLILACLCLCPRRSSGFSWNFSSSSDGRPPMMELDGAVANFAMDGTNDPRGLKLMQNARSKYAGPRNCWQEAYRKLFASCGDIMADEDRRSRLAWHLSSCFQEDSGRPPFPFCGEGSKMVHCRKRLRDSEDKVFLEFYLETNTLCHQLHTIQKLAQFGQSQQEESLSRQEQIRQAHDHLIQNSHSILEAQEEFRAKQANIFGALDKLYILHNAILFESRFIKAFFFYCCIVFLIYMLTSAKETFSIRGRLYFGLCITLLLEIGLIKLRADDFNKQFWVISKVLVVRMVFLSVATVQLFHSIFTFRDNKVLNHWLLQMLLEKVQTMEEKAGRRTLSYGSEESERSLRDYSRVFDELADEVDSKVDPSYMLPPEQAPRRCNIILEEEVGENSISTLVGQRYNLRPRK